MAVKDTDMEKESSGGWEKFLMISIPIVFTVVLLGVLLTLFNVDIRNNLLGVANKIPIVKDWVPDPVLDPEKKKLEKSEQQVESAEATIDKLKAQVSEKETELKAAKDATTTEAKKASDLQKKLDDAEKAAETAVQNPETESDYQKQIKDLAKMYADMSPSKAAPILQNMTNEEMVLLLSAMQSAARTKVLEKMDPKTAADVTMMMKDAKPSGDLALDALQSRLKKETATTSTASTTNSKNLDKNQLSQTFASMSASSGAKLLLETYKLSPDKTLTILNSVDDATRSQLLENMSTENSVETAKILNKLMGNK
ncbi:MULTISPECIES: MotE family protein [unclassified Paenibacillus]|uniref:MotE family protein n=1 Tax=unclassified Paenibacillus TaxID=185978 RepID=UPI0009A8F490|nr:MULTISPECIES: kinesin [unclassified Paenibacillus]SLJ97739.1 Flagellar motility protein MotE, a chaperone for MotC folding [Paenibacillus sp. RU5A]SOC66890.1 Flagellar motility protein MotE, a chaperone for MotC folding [Paenibacillus sp. RU26A]SOC69961.1 Flagellar motility protein MotE, a chaperone for MotC folding [Paenibacillus sp. RU5M]